MERVLGMAEGLDHSLHAGDVTVMVRAPDVDELLKSPPKLVPVIGDVGGEIGVLTVLLDNYPIFIIAKSRRLQPERAVLLISKIPLLQLLDGALNRTVRKQRGLGKPGIEPDTE